MISLKQDRRRPAMEQGLQQCPPVSFRGCKAMEARHLVRGEEGF